MLTALLLTSLSNAADIKVFHLGAYRMYRVSPGETVEDEWPPFVNYPTRRSARRPHHVTVSVHLREAPEGLFVTVDFKDEVAGEVVWRHQPTMLIEDPTLPLAWYEQRTEDQAGLKVPITVFEVLPEYPSAELDEPKTRR